MGWMGSDRTVSIVLQYFCASMMKGALAVSTVISSMSRCRMCWRAALAGGGCSFPTREKRQRRQTRMQYSTAVLFLSSASSRAVFLVSFPTSCCPCLVTAVSNSFLHPYATVLVALPLQCAGVLLLLPLPLLLLPPPPPPSSPPSRRRGPGPSSHPPNPLPQRHHRSVSS